MGRLCKNCQDPIPETKRIDAVFCSARCGWTRRNRIKREERLKAINTMLQDPIEKNYGIIQSLYKNNQTAISRGALIGMGFDPEKHNSSRIIQLIPFTMEFLIKDFELTLGPDKIITIKKRVP